MRDPSTVAFDIKRPWPSYQKQPFMGSYWYWPTLITIWHEDPETDHTDDSCGWFMWSWHGDPKVLNRIKSDFSFHWDRDRNCWFDSTTGLPNLSTLSITLQMFRIASRVIYADRVRDKSGWRGGDRFMRQHLYNILNFAENSLDSLRTFIEQVYGPSDSGREERIAEAASVVYGCLLRWTQPWYRHARWHVWHWRIQIHPLQQFKRWAFSRCAGCKKRFSYGYSPVTGSWNGTGPTWFSGEPNVYHSECFPSPNKPYTVKTE